MQITFIDKLNMRRLIYLQLCKLPSLKKALRILINPIDAIRDIEFTYLVKYLTSRGVYPKKVLDVSSPFIMSYVLSEQSTVIKTDINPAEKEMIKENANLCFKLEDATNLSFADNTFDLVYSISVIEHIYQNYILAVQEMIRVVKPGGLLYLTFPVAGQHAEEWLDYKIYPEQHIKAGKAFFQYRFDKDDLDRLLAKLVDVELIDLAVYWEKTDGGYNRVIDKLKHKPFLECMTTMRNGFVNFCSSINLMESKPSNFSQTKSFGNVSLLLVKTT
jgi:SAM-dependent methyltransferase